jgi:hypothetical protein
MTLMFQAFFVVAAVSVVCCVGAESLRFLRRRVKVHRAKSARLHAVGQQYGAKGAETLDFSDIGAVPFRLGQKDSRG